MVSMPIIVMSLVHAKQKKIKCILLRDEYQRHHTARYSYKL